MKIKDGYILKKVMGSYMIVSTNDDFNAMQTMNETGAFLWDELKKGASVDELCEKMTAEYDIDRDTAKKDIEAFLQKLSQAGLIED